MEVKEFGLDWNVRRKRVQDGYDYEWDPAWRGKMDGTLALVASHVVELEDCTVSINCTTHANPTFQRVSSAHTSRVVVMFFWYFVGFFPASPARPTISSISVCRTSHLSQYVAHPIFHFTL